jgi:hypothetical protein
MIKSPKKKQLSENLLRTEILAGQLKDPDTLYCYFESFYAGSIIIVYRCNSS